MDLKRINRILSIYGGNQNCLVALRMCTSDGEIPRETKMPTRDLGFQVAFCQAINTVRRFGWVMALGKNDHACSYGALTLGFLPAKKGWLDGSFDAALKQEQRPTGIDKESLARSAQALPRFEYARYKYVLMAPLEKADFEPQVILVYCNPAQIVTLVRGRLMHDGGALNFEARGGSICGNYITLPLQKDECQLGIPGAGERKLAMTKDHELFIAIPASKIEMVVEGVELIHQSVSTREPIPYTLEFQPSHPEFVDKLWDYAKESD